MVYFQKIHDQPKMEMDALNKLQSVYFHQSDSSSVEQKLTIK
jgi:hypothetical protein